MVDGFNLYHSVKDLRKATGNDYRWLNIASLCDSFLSAIGNRATRQDIFYFSALAYHRERWKPGGRSEDAAVRPISFQTAQRINRTRGHKNVHAHRVTLRGSPVL